MAGTATSGRLLPTRPTAPTTCTWIRLTSTQAQATAASITGGQYVALLLAHKFPLFVSLQGGMGGFI